MDSTIDPAAPYSTFGPTKVIALSKIQKLTGQYLSRNWISIPHVTHNDEADVTDLEARRSAMSGVTSLAFQVKAVVSALQKFPYINASLDESQNYVVLKQYFHIGIAVNTPKGLLVPVLRDADQLTIEETAMKIADVSNRARSKGLPMQEMSGGCFSISSLGRNGGTGFTPIINAPEVAILGVSKLQERAKRLQGQIAWRQMLPLSLSYDHRVINGADAAAFMTYLVSLLERPDQIE